MKPKLSNLSDYDKKWIENTKELIDAMNKELIRLEHPELTINQSMLVNMSDDKRVQFIWVVKNAEAKGISFFDSAIEFGLTHDKIFGRNKSSSRDSVKELRDSYVRKNAKKKGMQINDESLKANKMVLKIRREITNKQTQL